MPLDPSIPLSYNPPPVMGPAQMLSLKDLVLQTQNLQQQQNEKVQVKAALSQPGGVDQQGLPSLDAIGKITQINPELGFKMHQMREQISLRNFQNLEKKTQVGMQYSIARVAAYDRAIQSGDNPTIALQKANTAYLTSLDQDESSGTLAQVFAPQEINQARSNGTSRSIDMDRAMIMAHGGKIPGEMTPFQQQEIGLKKAEISLRERAVRTGEQREKRMGTGDVAGAPGGTGGQMMQDPATGQKYMVNQKTGKAWELDEEGQWRAINPANLPRNIGKVGNIGTAGARENVFTQRLVQAGNQASKDLENVTKLPITADRGPFGAFGSITAPSFLDAGKVVLANKMTSEEQQVYNAMSTGFQRTLAAIESAGLMPSGSLTHQMDAVIFKPGDTNLTKLHKLAQTRQIVESGLEVVQANPRISDSEKEKVKEIIDRLQKAVPFTHSDLIELARRQQENPETTMRDIFKSKGIGKKTAPQAALDFLKAHPETKEQFKAKYGYAPD